MGRIFKKITGKVDLVPVEKVVIIGKTFEYNKIYDKENVKCVDRVFYEYPALPYKSSRYEKLEEVRSSNLQDIRNKLTHRRFIGEDEPREYQCRFENFYKEAFDKQYEIVEYALASEGKFSYIYRNTFYIERTYIEKLNEDTNIAEE